METLCRIILFVNALSGLESDSFQVREMSQFVLISSQHQYRHVAAGLDSSMPESGLRLANIRQQHSREVGLLAVGSMDWRCLPWADGSERWKSMEGQQFHHYDETKKRGLSFTEDHSIPMCDRWPNYRYMSWLYLRYLVASGTPHDVIEQDFADMREFEQRYIRDRR